MNIVLAVIVIVVLGLIFLRWYNEAKEASVVAENDIEQDRAYYTEDEWDQLWGRGTAETKYFEEWK